MKIIYLIVLLFISLINRKENEQFYIAGYCSTTDLLTLMGSFVKERNYVVLGSINSNLSELVSLFDHLPCVTQVIEYGLYLLVFA